MAIEKRIFGDPGAGKTGKLAREIIPALVKKYGIDKVMLTSFTKAAAKELGSRIENIDPKMVGTLHSFCYRALKQPPLTEKYLNQWNEENNLYSFNDDQSMGKELMAHYQILKNKMIPESQWSPAIKIFSKEWHNWKSKYGYVDFIDVIEMGFDFFSPPGSPSVIVVDEAQDFTKLEMKLIRQWGLMVQELWLVGDDKQCIYSFSGAAAENMIYPEIPKEDKIYLSKSWRVPRTVHEVSQKIIKRVKVREKNMVSEPRDAEGSVSHINYGFNDTDWIAKAVLKQQGTSMILASCSYMLEPIIYRLKDDGIPFSNPWRKKDRVWNPLNRKGTDILKVFLSDGSDKEFWTAEQFISWAKFLKVNKEGLIRIQGKAGIKQIQEVIENDPTTEGLHTCRDFIEDILAPDAIKPALNRNVDWLYNNLLKQEAQSMHYALRIYKKHGRDAIFKEPIIYIGTIHSVKGAEASNVFIYPDISFASSKEMEQREGYDNLCRLFYVGVTRTKENLFLMQQSTKNFFEI